MRQTKLHYHILFIMIEFSSNLFTKEFFTDLRVRNFTKDVIRKVQQFLLFWVRKVMYLEVMSIQNGIQILMVGLLTMRLLYFPWLINQLIINIRTMTKQFSNQRIPYGVKEKIFILLMIVIKIVKAIAP